MIKLAILATVCLVGNIAMVLDKPYYDMENAENLFRDFVKEYEKSYNRKEYFERLEVFKETLRNINSQNAKHPETVFAVNHFADWKPEERQRYRGFRPTNETGVNVAPVSSLGLPSSFDWRDHGVVTHVKEQGDCGSCYIFSAIGNIEGQYAIKHKQCISLSEGQALDCLRCGGCEAGYIEEVMHFREFSKRAGVMEEKVYPYKPHKGTCHEDIKKVAVQVQGGHILDIQDEQTLMNKLVEIGPLSVGIGTGQGFDDYHSGIMYPSRHNCGFYINHAALLVGYGEDKFTGTKYWIIKNSDGKEWGENGYMRLLRGVNACHIEKGYVATAIVA